MNNFLNIKNLLIINIIIFFLKIYKKKIVVFYFPKKEFIANNLYFLESFFSKYKKDYKIFYLGPVYFKHQNFVFIKQFFLKYIIGVDLFISNFISDQFTRNSKKIYIHHDIYDRPLVEKSKEKELKKRLLKYNEIICASNKGRKIFDIMFKNKINIRISKYLKFEHALKNFKPRINNSVKSILIAPTNILSFPKFTMRNKLKDLIKYLISKNYNVILRPHPSNLKHKEILEIYNTFKNQNLFTFDVSTNYFKVFKKSDLMITDFSGSAYTYAFLNLKPVIFYFSNEKFINQNYYSKLNYFKDRSKIGFVCSNINHIKKTLKKKDILKKKRKDINQLIGYVKNVNELNLNELLV